MALLDRIKTYLGLPPNRLTAQQVEEIKRRGGSVIGQLEKSSLPPISSAETIRLQQKAAEGMGVFGGIRVKTPFAQRFSLRPQTAPEQFLKGIIELPESIVSTFLETPQILKRGGARPEIDHSKLRVENVYDIREGFEQKMLEDGASPAFATWNSVLFAGSMGILDTTIVGDLVVGGLRSISQGLPVKSAEHRAAWESLGKPTTIEEAQKTRLAVLRETSPNSSRANRLGTVNEGVAKHTENSFRILEESGIPSQTRIAEFAKIATEGTLRDVLSFAKRFKLTPTPFVKPAGLLPGARPVPGQAPALGLSIQEVETVGKGVSGVSKELGVVAEGVERLKKHLSKVYGTTLETAKKADLLDALKETRVFVPATPDSVVLKKVGNPSAGFSTRKTIDSHSNLIYGAPEAGFLTDTFVAITDKNIAKSVALDIIEKEEAKRVAGSIKILGSDAHAILKKGEKASTKRRMQEASGTMPQIEQIIPEGGESAFVQGIFIGSKDEQLLVVLSTGKLQAVVDANRLAFMQKHLPNAKIVVVEERKPVKFVEGGKVKGLLMPILMQDKIPVSPSFRPVAETQKPAKAKKPKTEETEKPIIEPLTQADIEADKALVKEGVYREQLKKRLREKNVEFFDNAPTKELEKKLGVPEQSLLQAEEFVKAQGTPVYHGKTKGLELDFSRKAPLGNQLPYGVHFTTNKQIADSFATGITKGSKQVGETIGATITAKKPFDVSATGNAGKHLFRENTTTFNILKDIAERSGIDDAVQTYSPSRGYFNAPEQAYLYDDLINVIEPNYVLNNAKRGIVEKVLKENGFDPVIKYSMRGTADPLGGGPPTFTDAWAVLDESAIKTRSQLTDIWNKANRGITPKKESPPEEVPTTPTKIQELDKPRMDAVEKTQKIVSTLPKNTKKIALEKGKDVPPTANNTQTIENDWRGFQLPPETQLQRLRRTAEDFNIRLKVLNDKIEEVTGEVVGEHFNLWAQKDMLPRKQSDILRRIREEKKDFVKRLVEADVKVDELDEYLHARHAKERNAKMNEQRLAKKQPAKDGLSGMTDEEADAILARDNSRFVPFEKEIRKKLDEILDFEVEQGLVKKELADLLRGERDVGKGIVLQIPGAYQNYVPLFRDLGEDFTGIGMGQGVSVPLQQIKRAKGSTLRVTSPLGNVFHRQERAFVTALKNDVGKTIIAMVEEYPFLKEIFRVEKEPVGIVARVERTAEIDKGFFNSLVSLAKKLGLEVFETKGKVGRNLGYFSPSQQKVVRRFATSRETLAHEIGHFFDDRFGLRDKFKRTNFFKLKYGKEEENLAAKEIFEHSKMEVGESKNRLAKVSERFANAFSWWMTHRDLAEISMPNFNKAMTEVIRDNPELKPLLDIKPTPRPGIEKITEDIWGKVFRPGDNVIIAKIDGAEHFITIRDQKTAQALKNLNIARIPTGMQFLRTGLAIWSSFKTRLRPEFLVTNFQRDLGEAMINLNVEASFLKEKGRGLKSAVIKDLFPSQRQVWKYLRGGENVQVDEFFRLGGDAGHFWLETVKDAEVSLVQLERQIKNVGIEKIKNPVRAAAQVVDDLNSMVELGVRYSTYKQLIQRGMEKQKAIQAVADLTLNFSRKGELSPVLKALYGFINPTIQGTSKVIRTIASKAGRRRMIQSLIFMTTLGFLNRVISMMIDEEGDEQISDWAKNHKFTFAIGNDSTITLWSMPYGYTTFHSLGSNVAEIVFGKKTAREATTNVVSTMVDSFSPFGTNLSDLTPTLAKPIFDINNNKGWYDGKIHPEQIYTKTPKPNSETYFESTTATAIFIASFVNQMTGGGEGKSGVIDIHPNDLEYMYDQYFGGPFEFVSSSIESGARGANGDFDPNKTPFVRQVYRENTAQQWAYGTIYDTLERAYKKELTPLETERFYRAVEIGVEEEIFDRDRADGYIQDFIKAKYQIVGNITDEGVINQLKNIPERDLDVLISTYAESTQRRIKRDLRIKRTTSSPGFPLLPK